MATIRDIISVKGNVIHSIASDASALDAIMKMNQHKIGALVVMADGRVAGIFTERDVLRRVVAAMKPAGDVRVGEVMTREVICCGADTDIDEVSAIMKARHIRHIPVCESDGCLAGMISLGDVNAHYASNQAMTIHYLNEYIYGRA